MGTFFCVSDDKIGYYADRSLLRLTPILVDPLMVCTKLSSSDAPKLLSFPFSHPVDASIRGVKTKKDPNFSIEVSVG